MGEVAVPGATFLNDVATAPDGGVYVTDTGVDASFKPTGADAVYRISKDGKLEALAKSKDLHGPNGVTSVDGKVYFVTFGDKQLREVPLTKDTSWQLPKGQLDGIIALAKDDFLISSWEGKTIYRGAKDTWKDLLLDIEGPADIGLDSKRNLLLIPHFNGNAITVLAL
jgi:sugar lactone lactonase YvrE